MGNLCRFVEPVVLLLLRDRGSSYGYELLSSVQKHALTDAKLERGTPYRTLRQLEKNGNVTSEWATEKAGPARRIYRLTPQGERHLEEWAEVLDHVSKSMARFVASAQAIKAGGPAQETIGI